MNASELKAAILASGVITNPVGEGEDHNAPTDIHFEGVMSCGLWFSLFSGRYAVELRAYSPEQHKHQGTRVRRVQHQSYPENGETGLEQNLQTVMGWLTELDQQTQSPELVSAEDLARVRALANLMDQAGERSEKARLLLAEDFTNSEKQAACERTGKEWQNAVDRWDEASKQIYIWDAA